MSMDTHDTIAELLGVYALDAVEPDERASVEAHLAMCAACRTEVDEHREVAAVLAETGTAPPVALWDRIQAGISVEAAAPTEAEVIPLRPPRRMLAPLAVAAAASVMVGLVAVQTARVTNLQSELAASQSQVEQLELAIASGDLEPFIEAALADPGTVTVSLGSESGVSGTVVLLADGTGLLTDHNLAPLNGDRTYQLWAIQDGRVISAGLLGNDPGVVPFHVDLARLDGLVITEEEAGGVPVSEQGAVAAWIDET
ncbi:MAG: anti-sigma factor [Acidimicrobiia bacterium]|jgi:anti-sigma-K factor RskA